jgi:hypothetical protein
MNIKPLIPAPSLPGYGERLLEEVERENWRAAYRDLLKRAEQQPAPRAHAKPKPRRRALTAQPAPAERWEQYAHLITKASRKAGDSNLTFCKLLDKFEVPVPRRWSVKTWVTAYNKLDKRGKPSLQAAIRRFKSRHKANS